jgi:hypothetical protein
MVLLSRTPAINRRLTEERGDYLSSPIDLTMVELLVLDEAGHVVLSLRWKRNSREVCYRFVNSKIAKASFKLLASDYWMGDAWANLGT